MDNKHHKHQNMPVAWHGFDNDLDRMFGLWPLRKHLWLDKQHFTAFPKVDVKESNNQYTIIADVPGLNAQNLKVEIDKELLTISGTRKEEYETNQGKGYIRIERSSGSFSRQIYLPGAVDSNEACANYENGTLTINIPKRKTAAGKTININHNKSKSRTIKNKSKKKNC
jgi:HSP20 family molecular chaperone IbpA